jgi:hypothetical protein
MWKTFAFYSKYLKLSHKTKSEKLVFYKIAHLWDKFSCAKIWFDINHGEYTFGMYIVVQLIES